MGKRESRREEHQDGRLPPARQARPPSGEPAMAGETIAARRVAGLPGVALVDVQEWRGVWRAYTDAYLITALFNGRLQSTYRDSTRVVEARQVLIIEAGRTVEIRSMHGHPVSILAAFVDVPVVDAMSESVRCDVRAITFPALVRDTRLLDDFSALRRYARRWKEGKLRALLVAMLRAVVSRHGRRASAGQLDQAPDPAAASGAAGGRRAAERAALFLHAHINEPVSLDALAREAGMSKYRLAREFRRAYILSPHAYHIRLRVAYARRLIERGVAVAVAAREVGFAGPVQLHRHFVRRFGVAPGWYAPACDAQARTTPADVSVRLPFRGGVP